MGEECLPEGRALTFQCVRPCVAIGLFIGEPIISIEIHNNLEVALSHYMLLALIK